MSLERDLKQALERHAGDARPSTDPLGDATTRLQQSRRRRAAGYVLGLAAVGAALGIALPKLVGNRPTQIIKPGPTPTPTASGFTTVTGPIQDIQLVSPGHGWVIQGGHEYWTDDAGRTWRDLVKPRDYPVVTGFARGATVWGVAPTTPGSIAVSSSNVVPVPCSQVTQAQCTGTVYASDTEDVRTRQPPNGAYGTISIFFIDQNRGWLLVDLGGGTGAAHSAQMFATTDGGRKWRELPRPPSLAPTGVQRVAFGDAHNGLITDGAQVYITSDGGASWLLVDPTKGFHVQYNCPSPTRTYGRPAFFSSTSALIPSGAGCPTGSVEPEIYETRDAGITWHYTATILVPGTDQMVLSTPTNGTWFAWIGTKHLYETSDAGAHWQQLTSNLPRHVLQLTFADGQDGWASVSRDGCSGDVRDCTDLYQTSNGGRSWSLLTVAVQISTPYCKASALAPHVVEQAGKGQGHFLVTVVNHGNVDCLAAQVPDSIQLIRADGSALPTQYRRSTGMEAQNFFPVLKPGEPIDLVTFWWANWCGTTPGRITIRMSLETATRPEILSVTFTPTYVPLCDAPRSPSTIIPELFTSSLPPSP